MQSGKVLGDLASMFVVVLGEQSQILNGKVLIQYLLMSTERNEAQNETAKAVPSK